MNRKRIYDIIPPKKFIKKKEKKIKTGFSFSFKWFFIFLFLFLVFSGSISYFVFSSVKVNIWLDTEILDFEEKIIASVDCPIVSITEGVIPALIFEVEEFASQEFPSSGTKEKKSEGIIRVYNNYNLLVNLRAGTRFQPPLEETIYFCSLDKIIISAKTYVDVKVQACRPGEGQKYNIGPSKFSVPGLTGTDLFFYVHGESFEPMKGGGTISQVTEEELESGKDLLIEQMSGQLISAFHNELQVESLRLDQESDDFILLEEFIEKEIVEVTSDAEAGEEKSFFNIQAKIKGKALAFRKQDIKDFIRQFVLTQISIDKKIHEESLSFDFNIESNDIDGEDAIINLKFAAKIYSDIDYSTLKESLKGKSFEEAKIILENQKGINSAKITAWPFWLQKIPEDYEKVEIEINLDGSPD